MTCGINFSERLSTVINKGAFFAVCEVWAETFMKKGSEKNKVTTSSLAESM